MATSGWAYYIWLSSTNRRNQKSQWDFESKYCLIYDVFLYYLSEKLAKRRIACASTSSTSTSSHTKRQNRLICRSGYAVSWVVQGTMSRVNLGGPAGSQIHPAPLIWDPLPLITDPNCTSQLRSGTFLVGSNTRHGTVLHFVTQRPSDLGIQRPGDPVDPVTLFYNERQMSTYV